jgi:uncharacterized membrane protein YkvA (DUF1232 family)
MPSSNLQLMDGMSNSVLLIFTLMMVFMLYILYTVLTKVIGGGSQVNPNVNSNNVYNLNNNNNSDSSNNNSNINETEECPICASTITDKVELDCSHRFCAACIMAWANQQRLSNFTCPCCRTTIRLINLLQVQRTEANKEAYDDITRYNHKNLNGYNLVTSYIYDFNYIFNLGISAIFSDTRAILYFILFALIVVYYLFTPYDLLPDTLGLVGYLDDFGLLAGFVFWIIQKYMSGLRDRVEGDYNLLVSQ